MRWTDDQRALNVYRATWRAAVAWALWSAALVACVLTAVGALMVCAIESEVTP